MHIEILRHAGIGRLGRLNYNKKKLSTPLMLSFLDLNPYQGELYISLKKGGENILLLYGSALFERDIKEFGILPDYNLGFSRESLVREALERTLALAEDYPEYGVTLRGGKFVHLWREYAPRVSERRLVRIGSSSRLIKMPRLLVEVMFLLRQTLNPNSAIYFPAAPPWAIPLLVFLGVDLLDNLYAYTATANWMYLTPRAEYSLTKLQELPCNCSVCSGKLPEELTWEELLRHNQKVMAVSIAEVRESIRHRQFYQLLEERSNASAESSASLRIAYREKGEVLESYAELY